MDVPCRRGNCVTGAPLLRTAGKLPARFHAAAGTLSAHRPRAAGPDASVAQVQGELRAVGQAPLPRTLTSLAPKGAIEGAGFREAQLAGDAGKADRRVGNLVTGTLAAQGIDQRLSLGGGYSDVHSIGAGIAEGHNGLKQ